MAKVLKNLDTVDLIRFTGVSKLWFKEGRKLLKTRPCYARFDDSWPCEDLQKFDKFLRKIVDPEKILYNGLYIPCDTYWHWKDSPGSSCLKYFDEVKGCDKPMKIKYKNVLEKLSLKYLKINFYGGEPLENCPGALLVPKLLLHHGGTLEEIDIEDGRYSGWLYNYQDMREGKLWLPNLKVLKGKPLEAWAFEPRMVWRLVGVAPNLEDLLICVGSKELRTGLAPENRYGIIKSLCFDIKGYYNFEAYEKFAASKPKLRCLVVKYSEDPPSSSESEDSDDFIDTDNYWGVLEQILRSSINSLEMIRIPAYVAETEMNETWQSFPNVTTLALEVPFMGQTEEQQIHEILRRYNFTKVFPNLTSITMEDPFGKTSDPGIVYDYLYDHENPSTTGDQDFSAKIQSLTLNYFVTDFSLAYSSSLFPCVKHLQVGPWGINVPVPYGTIWKEFPHLETLKVKETFWGHYEGTYTVNYDADFLGIYEAEAKRLRKMKNLEDLKNLHIVPIKPAITTCRSKLGIIHSSWFCFSYSSFDKLFGFLPDLREVTVDFMENHGYGRAEGEHFFLSPAACILSVQKMPNLEFKLVCSFVHEGGK